VAAFVCGIPILLLAYFVIRDTPESVGLGPDGEPPVKTTLTNVIPARWKVSQALKTRQFWCLFLSYSFIGIVYNGLLAHLVIWAVDLGSVAAAAGIFVTLFNGPSIGARVFGGMMGDRYGKWKIMLIGIALSFIVVVLGFFGADSPLMLGIFAVAVGLAIGFSNTLFAPYLGDLFGRENVGSLFGILTLGWGLIGGVGPLLWGEIFDRTGSYQPALLMSAFIYAAAVAAMLLVNTPSPHKDIA
jgi:MFS family permease